MPLIEGRYSGWGIDVVWAMLMAEPRMRAAVVDEIAMTHARAHLQGDLYPALDRLGIDAKREFREVLAEYPGAPRQQIVYGGILADGRPVGATRARMLNGAHLVRGVLQSHKAAAHPLPGRRDRRERGKSISACAEAPRPHPLSP